MILWILLIFGDLSLDDSYKLDSHKKKVCIVLCSLYFQVCRRPRRFSRGITSDPLVPKSGTFTSCVLGGARFHRLPEGVNDFTGNYQLGIVEGQVIVF